MKATTSRAHARQEEDDGDDGGEGEGEGDDGEGDDDEDGEEDELTALSARMDSQSAPSKRLHLSSLYYHHKQRLHGLLPKTQHPSSHSQSTRSQPTSPSQAQAEAISLPLSPDLELFDSVSLINKHFAPSLLPALSSSAFPSSSATDPIIADAQLEDGPLLRAQLSGLEHRASQLKKSIKPLIKVFGQIHANLCASLESDARLHQVLEILDETTPACFRPLKEIYHKSAKVQNTTIDEERKERLESKVLDPLRRMSNNLKEMSHRKKHFLHQAKSYDEALQKYLAIKSEGEIEVKKMEQMKAKVEFARIEYHHWIYEQAVFQEVEVLELLTEYMAAEHACRRSPGAETDTIGIELTNLRQELAMRHIERETQRRAMLNHRQTWRNKLDSFLQVSAGTDSTPHSRNTPGTPSRAKLMTRCSSAHDHPHASLSPNRTHELGGKLRGFAMTLTGKAFGGEEGGVRSPRGHSNLTIPDFLPTAVSDSAGSDNIEDLTTKSMRSWSANVQRRKEGFLLSCTKSIAAGGPQRSHNPTDQAQGTGGIPNGDAVRSWKKVWCVLAGGELREYKGDELVEPNRTGIDLRYAMVRPRKGKVERKFSFEVVTTQFVRVYQAFSLFEMTEWVAAVEACIEGALNSSSSAKTAKQKFGDEQARVATLTIPKPKQSHIAGRPKGLPIGNIDYPRVGAGSTQLPASHNNRKERANTLPHQERTLQVEWRPFEDPARNQSLQNPSSRSDHLFSGRLWKPSTAEDESPSDRSHHPRLRSRSTTFEEDLKPVAASFRPKDQTQKAKEADGHIRAAINGSGEDDEEGQQQEGAAEPEEEDVDAMLEPNWTEIDALSKSSTCAECGRPNPRWASYSLGILICINCCGIHRSLGSHISKVRSLDLDDWNDDQIRAIREIGNAKSKAIWEAQLPADFQVTPSNVKQFVHDKYVHKKFTRN